MGLLRVNRAVLVTLILAIAAFAGTITPVATASLATVDGDVTQLWQDPTDIEARDLYHGVGGEALAPHRTPHFEFVKTDSGGYSPGYDVRGPDGMLWSTKLGPEANTEVAMSRILWAIGFHQPPTYYVAEWAMKGGPEGSPGPARFRPELPDRKVVGEWSWYENEFMHTQPFKGLVVANVLLNNWDWKTSNNKIYEVQGPDGGRSYVVRDLGASLGKTDYPRLLSWLPMRGLGQGSRNNVEDFEEQGFIKRVEGDRIKFDYRGIHQRIVETLTTTDVAWTARLMARLSDRQWEDAFRAAGFPPNDASRYIAKIKVKIAEGLKLAES